MEQLLDGHAAADVVAVPKQIVGHLALKSDFVFRDLLKDEQGSELFSDGGDSEASPGSVECVRRHVGIADALGVDDLAVVGDENRAVEIAVLLVMRNKSVDPFGLARGRNLSGVRAGRARKRSANREARWPGMRERIRV